MKIKGIHLDAEEMPQEIEVIMTIDEAAAIAQWTGKLTPSTQVTSEIYSALVGGVFNRYWEDGLEGHVRGDGA